MKILTWNCRGIGRPRAIRNPKANIRTHNPDAIFMSKTLLHYVNTAAVVNRLGFSHFVYNPPTGKWGGVLFIWLHGVDVETVFITSSVIAMLVYSDPTHTPWLLTLVYCPAQKKHKPNFWNILNTLSKNYPGPLLSIGDFNSILKQSEKSGGMRFATTSSLNDLALYMEQQGMVDLVHTSPLYTWTNNRCGLNNIKERLDRGVANIH